MMKKFTAIVLASLLPISISWAADTEKMTKDSREAIKMLGGELKATLQASMKANGPIESISVCNIEAMKISQRISEEKGLNVGRTSLKHRNIANKPDAWEKSVLEQFEKRKAAGESPKDMDYSEVVDYEDGKAFRYMKAIPTGDVCLSCHGTTIAEPLVKKITSIYPDDKATGFNKGDIRGAFTVITPIK
jgi:hypothetical protein